MLQEFIFTCFTFYSLGSLCVLCAEKADSIWFDDATEDVCLTEECITSAARIFQNLDESVNPCEDFYQFACGGFADRILASDEMPTYVDTELEKTMKAQLKKLLQRPKTSFIGSTYKLKDMYDSCTNVAYMEELGFKPLKDILKYYGGWPILLGNKWDESKFDWKAIVSQMISDGLQVNLIHVGLEFNQGHLNSNLHAIPVIRVPESRPSLPRNSTFKNDTYMNLLFEVAVLLGASIEEAQQEMEELHSFRCSLNELLDESKTNENSSNICVLGNYEKAEKLNSTTLEDLYTITDKIDWLNFLKRSFSHSLTMQSRIICVGSADSFARLIDTYENAPKRVLANYLFSGVVRYLMKFIKSSQWDDIIKNARLGYIPDRPMSRWRICVPLVHPYFLPILTSIFVRYNYKSNEKENVAAMFKLIRKEFRDLFASADWLADETLEKGKQRIDDIIAFLAYADEILDDKHLEEYYREVSISPHEFLKNIWQLNKFHHRKKAEYLDKSIVRYHWDHQISLLMANAYYKPFFNTIEIPASQTRESYFTMNRPQALNFGSLGAIIGHEIGHSINQIGVPKRLDIPTIKWWTDPDVTAFRERAQCTVDQYSRYGLPKRGKINGTRTLDENISDNIGVLLAYRAYQSWLKDGVGSETKLPGLRFNNNQLFWISYANSWCFSYSFSRRLPNLSRSTHSWPKFRVLGSVSNSPDFAKDFNCPINSPMNPETKCSVW